MHPHDPCHDPDPRGDALDAAILFRDCAERLRASYPTGTVCRRLMRERALRWRRLVPPQHTLIKRA